MSKLFLGEPEARPYGTHIDGIVEADHHDIRVTIRRPETYADDSRTYVMANGWTAGKNSMRVPAIEAARFGHTAVTFEYTNTSAEYALAHNVEDFVNVVEALPRSERKAALGLSMGGAIVTMALEEVGDQVDRATLVAPGRYLHAHYYTPRIILHHLLAESSEARLLGGNVGSGIRLLANGVANCARRPQAIRAEFRELLAGNVHDELRQVKSQPNAPFIRFMYGLHDKLLPAYAQLASIAELPFDDVQSYSGGHARLAYDPTLADDIFALESQSLAA